MTLPDWLPEQHREIFAEVESLWPDFEAHRKAIKYPLTDQARKVLLTELAKLKAQGNDPREVVKRTLISGKWRGFFGLPDSERTAFKDEKPAARRLSIEERSRQSWAESTPRARGPVHIRELMPGLKIRG